MQYLWLKEKKKICRIKVEREISFAQAREHYKSLHEPPPLKAYAATVRTPSAANKHDDDLREKVGKLEQTVGELVSLIHQLLKKQPNCDNDGTTKAVGASRTDPGSGQTREIVCTQMTVEHIDSDSDETMEMTQVERKEQPGEWKVVGRGRERGGHKPNKPNKRDKQRDLSLPGPSVPSQEINPSPVITRVTKPPEKGGGQLVRKKSWVDLSEAR